MKKFLMVSVVLASSHVFAQGVIPSVDYSHCQQAIGLFGPQLNHKGEFAAGPGMQPIPDVKSINLPGGESETTYTFKGQMLGLNGRPQETKYKVKKDKNGIVTEVNTAQDKIDSQIVNSYKQSALSGAIYSGVAFDGFAYDPMVMVGPSAPGSQMAGGQYLPLSKLSKEQAKQFGVDLEELKALKKQKKRDQKSFTKISEGYSKLLEKSHIMIPNGVQVQMKVENGVCKTQQVKQIVFDAKLKQNQVGQQFNHERCESVLKIQQKYEKQLQSCANTNAQMFSEMNSDGGMNGGYAGGIAGGIGNGGYPGAIGNVGFGMGGFGIGLMSEPFQCQQYFGAMPQGGYGMEYGSEGGAAGGGARGSMGGSFGISSGNGIGY